MSAYPEILTDHYGLCDLIHDWYFHLDSFTFDQSAREACLYLGRDREPYRDARLMVTEVVDVSINDTAECGIYMFENLRFEAALVRVEGFPHIDIDLKVGPQCRVELMHRGRRGDVWGGYEAGTPRKPPVVIPTPQDVSRRLWNAIRQTMRFGKR